jgi:uncharacterized membrane protein (Fun14 family)
MEPYDMNYDLFVSKAATIGGGFFMGMLIGYFVRKILKLVNFALGGVFSLLVYLQYQGIEYTLKTDGTRIRRERQEYPNKRFDDAISEKFAIAC